MVRMQRDRKPMTTPECYDTRRHVVAVEVAVMYDGVVAVRVQQLAELFGHHNAAMASAGATDTDRQVRLSFLVVAGQRQREQAVEFGEVVARVAGWAIT